MMARYNAWQNSALREMVLAMDRDELTKERGAFFGSIMGTLNHLLWGDTLWMSRFDGGAGSDMSIKESVDLTPTPAVWAADRFRVDGRITLWTQNLKSVDLVGDLTWFSGAVGRDMSKPMALCVTHFFNHQTHHRGQVHAMLTAAGQKPIDTDIPFMPEDL
jgi:uncharacterized damage-inducible protein DinB